MGLRIVNNIAAQNAHRWLSTNDASMSKSLERLSSGYRINRAADDAAGLAISSQFRADIASFKVASRNTTEANALLQVAEGGIEQISNMLVRLKELATQSASANVGSSERAKINAEGNALISEIDRLANSTKYGSTTLLDGTFGSSKTGTMNAGTAAGGVITGTYVGYTFSSTKTSTDVICGATLNAIGSSVAEGSTWYIGCSTGVVSSGGTLYIMNANAFTSATIVDSYTGTLSAANTAIVFANLGITMAITGSLTTFAGLTGSSFTGATMTGGVVLSAALTIKRTGLTSLNVEGATTGTYAFANPANTATISLGNGVVTETVNYVANSTHTFSNLGVSFYLSSSTEGYDTEDLEGFTFTISDTGSTGATFQVGAKNDVNNRISLTIGDVRGSETNGLALQFDYLDTATEAQSMLDLVESAISTMSSRRGDIGSYMNRLNYAAANLAITIENVQAAESAIRDVDMASEMTTFTKNQILLQAGTAMLAQANTAPQSLLSLFGR